MNNLEDVAAGEIKSLRRGEVLQIFTKDYVAKLKNAFDALPLDKIERMAEILLEAYEKGNYVYIMGNGGSAATAAHMVCDLAKGTIWPVAPGEKRFRISCLADNTPLLTAWTCTPAIGPANPSEATRKLGATPSSKSP